jgi:hypothetical protein
MKNDKSLRGTMTRSSNIKTLMIISGVLLVLSLIGLSISATKPAQVTQKTALISYTQNSQFDYTVYLKPSYLYGPTPEVTTTSVAQFPQNVVGDIAFTYSFLPAVVNTSGTAWVQAVLENPGVWQKTLELVPNTTTSGNFTLDFSLDTQQVAQIFKEIADETGIAASAEDVMINAYFQSGAATSVQSLPITIQNNLIEIPNSLSLTQEAGSGQFAYNINNVVAATQTATVQGTTTTTESYPSFNLIAQTPVTTTTTPLTILAPGQIAFVNLIKSMDVNFGYQFQANKPVQNLSTSADITATLAVPQSWSKNFDLLQTTKSGNFTMDLPLDIASYMQLIQSINSETGSAPTSYTLTITANIHTTGDSSYGPIDETFSPTMNGTITSGVLTWNQNLTDSKAGAISQTNTVANKSFGLSIPAAETLFGILSFIFFLCLVFLIMFYSKNRAPGPSSYDREIEKIHKKYGTRIAESISNSENESQEQVSMNSIDDLVKISDELGKPVVHRSGGPSGDVESYYVIDGNTKYEYSFSKSEGQAGETEGTEGS